MLRSKRRRWPGSVFFILTVSLLAPSAFSEEGLVGVTPTDADVEAMRQTVRQLESIINERAPEGATELVSPRLTDPERRGILNAVEEWIGGLETDRRYYLRTDFGRAALVPTGPERIQMHINGTIMSSRRQRLRSAARRDGDVDEDRQSGSVLIELEAVETEATRRWLLVGLSFPGQRQIFVGGLPPSFPYLLTAAGVLAVAIIAFIVILRRKSLSNRLDDLGGDR